ncbi:MAG TPA: gluconokinase [Kiritimatiellia bacterium]|nr:gluconokinase [Kiritimatiellia bacterium]
MNVRHVIVMGVSGSGKTSVGKALADKLGCRFVEGDDFHPKANIDKMSAGIPLMDDDRWPWLNVLHDEMIRAARREESVVLSCSALKQTYRDRLTAGLPSVLFIYLKGDREALLRNLQKREGHFMKANMLDSQLRVLEEPENVITLPCEGSVEDIATEAARRIHEA